MTTLDDDRPLIHRAKEGDFAAFESLVASYEQRIYGLALRIVPGGELMDSLTEPGLIYWDGQPVPKPAKKADPATVS